MKRKDPNLSEKLAALVIHVFEIDREHAKQMTTAQLLSLVQFDHDPVQVEVAQAIGWTPAQYNHPTNLRARLILDHRHKTATEDIPIIRKTDRISEAHAAFQRRILAKGSDSAHDVGTTGTKPRPTLRSRPFQKAPEGHKWFKKRGKA